MGNLYECTGSGDGITTAGGGGVRFPRVGNPDGPGGMIVRERFQLPGGIDESRFATRRHVLDAVNDYFARSQVLERLHTTDLPPGVEPELVQEGLIVTPVRLVREGVLEGDDVLRTADVLTENQIFIEAGPSKHNNSQAFYLYSYEPGGNRIEVYSGSFLVLAPDFEPVTWNEAERGTGVYWGSALPASFLEYATPDVAVPAALPEQRVPVFDPR